MPSLSNLSSTTAGVHDGEVGGREVVDIYPLQRYYFGSREAIPDRDETFAERTQRLKSNFEENGMRISVGGVILVELFKKPHVLLLQVRNSSFKLPGGRLLPGESDIEGLKRKLSSKICADNSTLFNWEIGECLGTWWRSDFDTLPCPCLSPNARNPKECIKIFLVRPSTVRQFIVPKNMKFLVVPLHQIHRNSETYGPIISKIPRLLSRFSFNIICE